VPWTAGAGEEEAGAEEAGADDDDPDVEHPVRIARYDGRDHLPVLHGHHRSSPTAHEAAQTG
jgi:hypothetical protein